jgi:conjugative transposon TraJ protein
MRLLAIDFENLHQILQTLYAEMMPLCSDMTGVAKGIAGLGALFYVAYRVWQQLSRAEPIDVFPLLRPFVIGLCIMFFPTIVLGTLNSVMSPIVKGANQLVQSQMLDMDEHRRMRDQLEYEAHKRNPEMAYLVDKEEFDKKLGKLGAFAAIEKCGLYLDRAAFNAKRTVQKWFRELLELLFQAAALIIDTIRTFFLVVLSILGPVAFALSVWDGFQSGLTQWITRYLSVYLWLPVSDLFSCVLAKIQVLMLRQDIEQFTDPAFIPDGSSAVYIIFMLIGIVGYFTIPSVAGWIIAAGGMGNYGKNVNQSATKAGNATSSAAGAALGNIAGRLMHRRSGSRNSQDSGSVNGDRTRPQPGNRHGSGSTGEK